MSRHALETMKGDWQAPDGINYRVRVMLERQVSTLTAPPGNRSTDRATGVYGSGFTACLKIKVRLATGLRNDHET